MSYQSPSDRFLVAQQPTSDWRDEQWVTGYGLFVNTLVYSSLKILGRNESAENMRHAMSRFTVTGGTMHRHVHEGLVVKHKPYYAFWSYKIFSSERFDLLGNSLAILSGIASPSRADEMISWIEEECTAMRERGELQVICHPTFFLLLNLKIPTGTNDIQNITTREITTMAESGLLLAGFMWQRWLQQNGINLPKKNWLRLLNVSN